MMADLTTEVVTRPPHITKNHSPYMALLEQVQKLSPTEAIKVTIPEHLTQHSFQSCVRQYWRMHKAEWGFRISIKNLGGRHALVFGLPLKDDQEGK